ncbi:sialomucin core protein 24 isoform X1 [Pungitius pungitius]|uniref:sialomucin core protein 24 isoform X1 n=1 Tax=Pungitius pungitius TaxID=134920 RepID=UPI001887EB8F|nr:sialomucin core protein 24 isoform X1 [Pungitius pungitius]
MYSKVVFFAVVLALVGASAATDSAECTATLCDPCGPDNVCRWFNCSNASLSCLNTTLVPDNSTCILNNCSAFVTSTTLPPTTAPPAPVVSTTSPAPPTTDNSTNSTVAPTQSANVTGTTAPSSTTSGNVTQTTPIAPSPAPHNNTFDAASFIGGIVLILGLQAVIFFVYKFCKSKDRNYHTL